MGRRIDALYCTKEDAAEKSAQLCNFVQSQAQQCQADIEKAFKPVEEWLARRRKELEEQVAERAARKQQALKDQLEAIRKGECEAAPPEDPEAKADPNRFMLCTDGVIRFEGSFEDIRPCLDPFGKVWETSTYASHSVARGPVVDETMRVGVESFVNVIAKDLEKVQRKDGGETIEVNFLDSQDAPMEEVEHSVEDLKDGRYRIRVTANAEGRFKMRVRVGTQQWEAEDIAGSPFELEVLPPPEYSKIGVDRLGDAGKPWVQSDDVDGSIRHPSGMCFDRTGKYVFVADQANDRLQVFDVLSKTPIGVYGRKGSRSSDFDTPTHVVADREDKIYVSDMLNHRVQVLVFNPKSKSLWHHTSLGGPGAGPGQFDFPRGLAVTEEGNLVVCDMGNKRVQVLDASKDWAPLMSLEAPQEMTPLDVTVNRAGEILVSCGKEHCIHVFADGAFSRTFGNRGGKDGLFRYPVGITVDEMNRLFVCDQGNRRMQILDAVDGSYVHQWKGWKATADGQGVEEEGGDESPPASPEPPDPDSPDAVEFMGIKVPMGVAVNSQGTILVSDYSRHLIFKY